MAEDKPWWDLGHQISRAGFQVSRAGNAFANAATGFQRQYEPGEFDMWGVKKTTPTASQMQVGKQNGPTVAGYDPKNTAPYVLSPEARKEWKPAPPTTPAPSDPVNAHGKGVSDIQFRWDALYGQVANRKNPYADRSSLNAQLAQSDANVSRQYANAERQGMERMAARGMMGSGQEVGLMGAIDAERANAFAQGRNALESQWTDKANAWQQQQDSAIASVLGGQFGALNGYVTQAELPGLLKARDLENQIRQAQAQTALPEAMIRQKMMEYELSDNEWDRQNPVAAFLRDMGIGMASGVGQGLGTGIARNMGG